jgi:carbonic anhydrase
MQISDKQKPMAAILGCADSRVPAEIVFDQGFGDVFVCRVAGNIATAEELASLEYAVLDLGVKVVMILGHTKCGAVKAALSGGTASLASTPREVASGPWCAVVTLSMQYGSWTSCSRAFKRAA